MHCAMAGAQLAEGATRDPMHRELTLPAGARVLVFSDIHIPAEADSRSLIVAEQLSATIDAVVGPAAVVLAGDCFELDRAASSDPAQMLADHPRLSRALERFTEAPDRHVVVLAGQHDAAIAECERTARPLCERGWTVGDTLDLHLTTATGTKTVRVEHGSPLADGEPAESGDGPESESAETAESADADDHPTGDDAQSTPAPSPRWLRGDDDIDSAEEFFDFYWSRWVTRRLLGVWRPLLAAVLVAQAVLAVADPDGLAAKFALAWGALLVVWAIALAVSVTRRARRRAREIVPARRGVAEHRLRAHGAYLGAAGYSGLVCGATHLPMLAELGRGQFIANTGSCDEITIRCPSWIGLPVFRNVRQLSWVELEAANDLQVRLVVGRTTMLGEPWIEALLARGGDDSVPRTPTTVATLPYGPTSWSTEPATTDWTQRTRRFAAIGLWLAALVNLGSALTRPLRGRAHLLRDVVPLTVSTTARVSTAALAVLLAVLAVGVRRGRRAAWFGALILLVAVTVLDVLKGIDVEEGLLSLAVAAWLVLNRRAFAVRRRHRHRTAPDDRSRAREVVANYGGDTLAYFALRDDKQHYYSGESLVAYAIVGNICLVSPDPIGPPADRVEVWNEFRAFARDHGWTLAVVGAGEEWLTIYRAAGMLDLYIGDEAIVDVQAFTLQGGANKSLRHGVNRVRSRGYHCEFFAASNVDAALQEQLRELMGESRRGDVERGFSMTLGRVFDPDDRDLLLAVAFGPDGSPAAFCQFAPAADIAGYSLDLMRRRESDPTNGLIDFVVVETIEHLRHLGHHGLGLNFATLRTVVSGESHDNPLARVERWAVGRLGDSMQIESLWRYNEKFRPSWRPRYAVIESRADIPAVMMAFARAESWWELPVIGRFVGTRASSSRN